MSVPENQTNPKPLLEVIGLKKYFPIQRGFLKQVVGHVKAVDDVNFHVAEGETLGLVGESGCGKTTTGRCIVRAINPSGGQVWYQDPYASLNPRMTLQEMVGAPLRAMGIAKGKELEEIVAHTLTLVGLRPEYMPRYPHAFSGGQRQRIGLARALAPWPTFVVCDEPVSALNVSVQAQILNLLKELQEKMGLTYLFVAHDLGVVAHTSELFANPKHRYTEALMSAIPLPDPRPREKRVLLTGKVANPANPPSGCYFHPRCKYAKEICSTTEPPLEEVTPGHYARCHRAKELSLVGAIRSPI